MAHLRLVIKKRWQRTFGAASTRPITYAVITECISFKVEHTCVLWRFENALLPDEWHEGFDRLYVP